MDPAVPWLLSSADPSIRFLALTEVLGRSPGSREARAAREAIPRGPRVRALLRGQHRDGGFGVHPYRKWTGAHWRLVSLVELAIPPGHPRAVAAARTVLAWVEEKEDWRAMRLVGGLPRLHASQEGNAIAVACRLGLARDPVVRRLVQRLVRSQWPDGGWNCDPAPEAAHSSFHETLIPLWGLAEYARATGDPDAARAADRAAELLLSHRLFRSHRTGEVVDPEWLRFHHPPYWHYDVLHALLILSRWGKVADPRAADALDLLEGKRRPDGRWDADGRRYWRPPGSAGPNVEAVDWGPSRPSPFVTLDALRVLRAAGRLQVASSPQR
ncbi:MAG TPA: hypothetical protein VNO79_01865 [Actinomycetota bacterium]|nr:hypothetical protein [Actinomycetota bacterium]